MRIFDPHAHMTSRTTDDYEAMAAAGVRALVEPAFWLGQPRTSSARSSTTSTRCSAGSAFRAAQFGIRHHCTIGAQPEGGQRRRAAPRGARRAAALPGQGRRRRGRRDRLRRDDARRRTRRSPRSSRSRSSTSCRCSCTRRTATRPPARASTLELVESPALAPGHGRSIDHNNELTVHDGRWPPAAGRASRSTRTRRWTSTGWCAILQRARPGADHRQLRRRLGRVSDPLKIAQDRRRDAGGGLRRRRHRPGRLAQPGRVLRPERPADPRRPAPSRDLAGDVRGQLGVAARRERADAPAAPRRQPAPPRVLLQRPSGRRPRRRRRRSSTRYAARVRERLDVAVLGVGLWLCAGAARSPTTRPRRDRLAPQLDRLRPRGRHAQRLPVPRRSTRRWSSATSTGPTGPTPARRDYTLGLAAAARRGCCPTTSTEGSISTLPLGWRDAVGRRPRRRAPRDALDRARRRARRAAGDDRPADPGRRSSPSPAARSRRSTQAVDAARRARAATWIGRLPRRLPPRGAVRGRRPARSPRLARRRACRSSRRRCRARCASSDPGLGRRARAARRASTSRASCTRCASASNGARRGRRRPAEALGRRRCPAASAVARALPRARCTRRRAAATADRRAAAHARPRSSAAPRAADRATSRSRPTRGASLPPTRRGRRRRGSSPGSPASWPGRATGCVDARPARRSHDRMTSCVVLDVVGLTPRALAAHAAAVAARRPTASRRRLDTVLPGGHLLRAVDACSPG